VITEFQLYMHTHKGHKEDKASGERKGTRGGGRALWMVDCLRDILSLWVLGGGGGGGGDALAA